MRSTAAKNGRDQGRSDKIGSKAQRQELPVIRQASETGQLYGSVSPARSRGAAERERLRGRPQSIRAQRADQDDRSAQGAGASASEVEVTVTVNVARSADEAERLARGENVTVRREGGEEADEAEAVVAAAENSSSRAPAKPSRRAARPAPRNGQGLTAAVQSKMS